MTQINISTLTHIQVECFVHLPKNPKSFDDFLSHGFAFHSLGMRTKFNFRVSFPSRMQERIASLFSEAEEKRTFNGKVLRGEARYEDSIKDPVKRLERRLFRKVRPLFDASIVRRLTCPYMYLWAYVSFFEQYVWGKVLKRLERFDRWMPVEKKIACLVVLLLKSKDSTVSLEGSDYFYVEAEERREEVLKIFLNSKRFWYFLCGEPERQDEEQSVSVFLSV